MSKCDPASVGNENARGNCDKMSLALRHLNEALRLLDESDAPPEVGAQLDLAIHRLRAVIERFGQGRD